MIIGYWLLVIGYWLLVIGYWLLVIGYWLMPKNPLSIAWWVFYGGLIMVNYKQNRWSTAHKRLIKE